MSETKQIYNVEDNETEDIKHKKEQEKPSLDTQQILQKNQSSKQQKTAENTKADQSNEEQMPDKFYDSDLASVNEKDFLSDNQPPKDIAQQRKLLHKQKTLHIYKTILRVGLGIDKPAPFDQIKLRYAQQTQKSVEGVKKAKQINFIQNGEFVVYNLGKEYSEIQRLVTSMRQGEIATFQLEELEVSKKSNIKILKNRQVYTIQVQKWITVIDIDGNKDMLKYLLRRGEGPNRVCKYDQVTYQATISYKQVILLKQDFEMLKIQQETIDNMHPIIWKMLCTMKRNQFAKINLTDQHIQKLYQIGQIFQTQKNQENKQFQQSNHITKKYAQLLEVYNKNSQSNNKMEEIQQKQNSIQSKPWQIIVQVKNLISIDDIFMNGTVLKKMLIKGVSTAKPESASLIYYALKFLDANKKVLHEDACFNSDWWEDYGKLDILGCRKNYLDQFKVSQFLKASMKRMKPAEVSEIQCRDMSLFTYGNDYEELKKLCPAQQEFPPQRVYMVVRVYNFTEGKNCFNTDIDQKVQQSRRKKIIAVKLLNEGKIQQAYKRFQNIISFYNAGNINQDGYNQKISSLMNSILCLLKQNKFSQMIPLCDMVLQKPRHGFNQDKMKINAQGIKLQGKSPNNQEGQQTDSRQVADLQQNQKIIDKCLYRKALALLKTGESKKAIECLENVKEQNVQVKTLKEEAEKHLQNYEQKSKKMFKNMFQKA